VDDFGGVAKAMPAYSTAFLIVTLSSIGLPGLNGFIGEFLVIAGAFAANRTWAAVAATGVVLGAIYMLKLYRDVFFGPITSAHKEKLVDASRRELAALAPLIALIVVIGVRPAVVLDVTQKSADKFVQSALRPAGAPNGR
jgi:NADH-quinone oxidoreductase subunit M